MNALSYKSIIKTAISPVQFVPLSNGLIAIDFGKVWFGTVRIRITSLGAGAGVTVRMGECLSPEGRIDTSPPGSARFRELQLPLRKGGHWYQLEIPSDSRNTGRRTLKMPEEMGEVLPFRYVEIDNIPKGVQVDAAQHLAVHYPFDDDASDFDSSDDTLNDVWALSKHTMFATTFCGMFVDGDRERYPREADAYINQLGYYCVDAEYGIARQTHEFMIKHSSVWTEWLFQSIFMAWADLLYTGNDSSLRRCYNDLQAKLLLPLARDDGLISTNIDPLPRELRASIYRLEGEHIHPGTETILRDIVDWPDGERDSYDFCDYNTVVNAFHYMALVYMSRLASRISREQDAEYYRSRAALVKKSFLESFFDDDGLFVDGEGSKHSSIHANMFPLAFGLIPRDHVAHVVRFIEDKGMACSVYGAQYLLEALFLEGRAEHAIHLITADGDRSWKHMLAGGATLTTEAWDVKYKPNMDLNHPWGAAPANILPRYVLGVQPKVPGAHIVTIKPQPGPLKYVRGNVPTIHGPLSVECITAKDGGSVLELRIPEGVTAEVAWGSPSIFGAGTHTIDAR